MEKIEIKKYITTFKDEQGNVIGYGIVGNLVELVEKIEHNNSVYDVELSELIKRHKRLEQYIMSDTHGISGVSTQNLLRLLYTPIGAD